jgi:alginate O-acetyltransferase complex protein AlgI
MDPASLSAADAWLGALAFTFQIYFDFSGYSDMAIGLGRMFGFRFLENFNYPLAANSVTDFWRRWHISLGTFFRDYVYIPLGGNRRHQPRNIFIVWLLTGFWHGASWNFVLWGLYYAVFLLMEKAILLPTMKKWKHWKAKLFSHIYTPLVVIFGFVLFYFDHDLFKNIGYLFGIGCSAFSDFFTGSILLNNLNLLFTAVILALPIVPQLIRRFNDRFAISYGFRRGLKTACLLVLILISTICLVGNSYSPFLYFRF